MTKKFGKIEFDESGWRHKWTDRERLRATVLSNIMAGAFIATPIFFIAAFFFFVFHNIWGIVTCIVLCWFSASTAVLLWQGSTSEANDITDQEHKAWEEIQAKKKIPQILTNIWENLKAQGWSIEAIEKYIDIAIKNPEWIQQVETMTALDLSRNPPLEHIENAEAWARKADRTKKAFKRKAWWIFCLAIIASIPFYQYWPIGISILVAASIIVAIIAWHAEKTIEHAHLEEATWRKKFATRSMRMLIPDRAEYAVEIPLNNDTFIFREHYKAEYVIEIPIDKDSTTFREKLSNRLKLLTFSAFDNYQRDFRRNPTKEELHGLVKVSIYPLIIENEIKVFWHGVVWVEASKSQEPPPDGIVMGATQG